MKKIILLTSCLTIFCSNSSIANSWTLTDVELPTNHQTLKKMVPKTILVSGDGKSIFMSFPSRWHDECKSYRWSKQSGYEEIGDFCIMKVNHQGDVIFGANNNRKTKPNEITYRWTAMNGKKPLLPEDGTGLLSVITDMDDKGTTFTGYVWDKNCQTNDIWPMKGFIWRDGNIEYLEAGTNAVSISGDGNTILVQKNSWRAEGLCPVNYPLDRIREHLPFAMEFDDFISELIHDEKNRSFITSIKSLVGNAPEEKIVLTGLLRKGKAQIEWIGNYYPIEMSEDGNKVLLRSYDLLEYKKKPRNDSSYFSRPWPFLLWSNNEITMTGWIAHQYTGKYFFSNGQFPEGIGFYATTEVVKKNKNYLSNKIVDKSRAFCNQIGPASKNGLYSFCKEAGSSMSTLIFEKNEKGLPLKE